MKHKITVTCGEHFQDESTLFKMYNYATFKATPLIMTNKGDVILNALSFISEGHCDVVVQSFDPKLANADWRATNPELMERAQEFYIA
jgi:hypothetical protein